MQFKKAGIIVKKFLVVLLHTFWILFIANNSIVAQKDTILSWHSERSPIFSNLNNIILFSEDDGFSIGDQVLQLTKNGWKIFQPQPAEKPNVIFALNNNNIWIVTTTEYQDSKLFFYNGKKWTDFQNPLANKINDIKFINRNFGVACGLGEVAVYRDGRWKFLEPPTPKNIVQTEIDDDSTIWVRTFYEGIYKYNNNRWKYIDGSDKATLCKLTNNKLYLIKDTLLCYAENDTTVILTSNYLLKDILSFDVLNDGTVFAVGIDGLILKYDNGIWTEENLYLNYRLNSVKMLSNTFGWIAGNEGTILKYSFQQNENSRQVWKGFQQIKFYQDAKAIDDEYGVVVADLNNDGLPDIFTCGLFEENHLYMNQGENSFTDQAEQRGLIVNKKQGALNLGACAGDLDNDGDEDLYVSVLNGANKIYWNLGDGYFVDYSSVCNAAGGSSDRTNSVIIGDVDNDGDLDIFIANENITNRLFLNNGAGIFEEVTKQYGLETKSGGTGCSFADIDNDGDLDLYVTNWSMKNILYKNLLKEGGRLLFKDITDDAQVGGFSYTKSNAVVFADIDNDGDLDLFVTNRKTSNRLYINDGYGNFADETKKYIGLDSMKSYGAVIVDFDGDGYKDIYLANVGENVFYKNNNGKKFQNKTIVYGAELNGYSTGTACGDFDNDGDPDLYVANYIGGSSSIFINNRKDSNFIKLRVEGVKNNNGGVGTKVFIYPSGYANDNSHLLSYESIKAGGGYASMDERVLTFGTQNYKSVDIKLIFPLGESKFIRNVKPGTSLTYTDVTGIQKYFIRSIKWFTRIFLDKHIFFQVLKWLFVLGLIIYSGFRGKNKFGWQFLTITSSALLILAVYYLQFRLFEYRMILFSTILPLLSIILLLVLLHLFYERQLLKITSEAEKQLIREKLSRDLHDDLASTVGSIAIYVELLKKLLQYKDNSALLLFKKTQKLIDDATYAITDLIWTIKPSSESLSQLLVRINENFINLFTERGVEFKIERNIENGDIKLESPVKHNIYLILKEALSNILKYASAENVNLVVVQKGKNISFTIEDDGKGFDINKISDSGNGLKNMRKRSEEIGANFNIKANLGEGTKIMVNLKIA